MLGPRRFSDIRADLPGISANVLTQRLAELEERGLVRRRKMPPPASVQVYEATDWGLEAEPVLQELGRWAARSPRHDPGLGLSAVSLMLSFRTMIDRRSAGDLNARIGFRFGSKEFVAELEDGQIETRRGPADGSDVLFIGSPPDIAAVVYGGAPLGSVRIEGDHALAERFASLFPLPPKVEAGPRLP